MEYLAKKDKSGKENDINYPWKVNTARIGMNSSILHEDDAKENV